MISVLRMHIRVYALIMVMFWATLACGASNADPLEAVRPFLEKYCTDCHGAEVKENSKRFDNLKSNLEDLETLQLWQGVVDQLNLGDMPPKDAVQPTDKEVAEVINRLTIPKRAVH